MKKLSKIIVVTLLTATVSQTSLAAEVPIESAPCNATVFVYTKAVLAKSIEFLITKVINH